VSEIVTGDAVVVDLPCARFPTRSLGHVIDLLVQIPLLIAIAVGASAMPNEAAGAAMWVVGYVLVLVGYPVIFETLSRGKTLGKMALGLRAVSDDGGPVRFRQALVRGLAGAVECWALLGVPALIASMFSVKGRRLGDIFAGTFVLRERVPSAAPTPLPGSYAPPAGYPGAPVPPGAVPPPGVPVPPGGMPPAPPVAAFTQAPLPPPDPALAGWRSSLDLSALPDSLASSAASYLSRYWELHVPARDQLGLQLASGISAVVTPPPPPGLPPAAYLGAVLAERRDRELRRYAALAGHAPARPGPPAPPPPPAAPSASPEPPAPEAPAAPAPPRSPGGLVPPA